MENKVLKVTENSGARVDENAWVRQITQKGTIKIGTTTITDLIQAYVTRNLLSVPKLMQKNYTTVFIGNKCRIYDRQ